MVIGASVAGCLVAAVLARRFARVTLVEKEDFFDETGPRRALPQEHHVHLLLLRGKQIMERIFPGLLADLEAGGAQVADLGHDVKCYHGGLWKSRYRCGIHAHYCSRRLIDNHLRRHILRMPRVDVLSQVRVTGLSIDHSGAEPAIRGVHVSSVSGDGEIPADLVVDASGRGTRMPEWLERAGFGRVEQDIVNTNLGYASRLYRRMPEYAQQWQVLLVLPHTPLQRSMGVISPVENSNWMVTTGGWFGHCPGRDPDEFLRALAALPVPDIHDVVRRAPPLSDVAIFRMSGSARRHYERLEIWPRGLLVAGDALASMNPLYSQGMTLCALAAECIDTHIDSVLVGRLRIQDLQRRIAEATEPAWHMAATEDLRFPETAGERSWRTRFHHWYGAELIRLSARHRQTLETQIGVTNLVTAPARLFAPAIVSRIALGSLHEGRVG